LHKIAVLSTEPHNKPDFTRLHNVFPAKHQPEVLSLSQTPISLAEVEVLFALCEAAPLLQDLETAQRLLDQLSPYLLEAHTQAIAPSPFLRFLEPSPWEALGYQLTRAVLVIGIKYPVLHDTALDCTTGYLRNCLQTLSSNSYKIPKSDKSAEDVEVEDTLDTATVSVSLLGFLEAISHYINFYSVAERLEVVDILRQILDENLMVSVEGVFSSIRTSEGSARALVDWRAYVSRYAATGRPIGAMLLQRGFMRLLVSCSSLQVSTPEQLQKMDIFDILKSNEESVQDDNYDINIAFVESMSDFAIESMRLLEDGSDYLQLGSAWQQRLAFAVKAYTIQTFLNCIVVDEGVADVDTIMSWLEDTMADPIQMADETLAYVVLKSMAVIAKISPSIASTLSHSLPRFVVQSGIKGETVVIAAESLTYILQLLSQDAVITGLYSLGNVLSARSGTDRVIGGLELPNGNANGSKSVIRYTQHSSGSAISLDLNGEEQNVAAYGNIVLAIVSIANSCQDEKITALAQSMLLQKLGRVSLAVDLRIITEAAKLATTGCSTEFKALLKLYARLGHEAVVRGNTNLSDSVRCLNGL
jgi:phosphatidylinositol 4-kinase